MPIFEFVCNDCGEIFEELIMHGDEAPACPKCGHKNASKSVSAPSPLKKGAFPFKPGPVHPIGNRMSGNSGGCAACHNKS